MEQKLVLKRYGIGKDKFIVCENFNRDERSLAYVFVECMCTQRLYKRVPDIYISLAFVNWMHFSFV